jgi:hypothetical protein
VAAAIAAVAVVGVGGFLLTRGGDDEVDPDGSVPETSIGSDDSASPGPATLDTVDATEAPATTAATSTSAPTITTSTVARPTTVAPATTVARRATTSTAAP